MQKELGKIIDQELQKSKQSETSLNKDKKQFQMVRFEEYFLKMLEFLDVHLEDDSYGVVYYKVKIPSNFSKIRDSNMRRTQLMTLFEVMPKNALKGFDEREAKTFQMKTQFFQDLPIQEDLIGMTRIMQLDGNIAFTESYILNSKTNEPLAHGIISFKLIDQIAKL
ncbi:UNKNOWN [Stylonychia lemnae]|uniref:Uncharacterized protein n=1 Tax=Stylonychia lemnae TaxID=5949 RepID=A0A078AH57_STYLE|nr:UNKNOWN [Stylonychia lemnae]|eukprot:CDW80178.1 UNKNOWN [Stylonychia lemnae]